MTSVERERVVGFARELNDSGFPNKEISRQCGLSLCFVEQILRGEKGFIWKRESPPPSTRRWCWGNESAALELKRLRAAIGECLWELWDTKTAPVPRRGPGRPAAVRPHQVIVARAVRALAAASNVGESAVWRWIYPSRLSEIYRTRKPRKRKGR